MPSTKSKDKTTDLRKMFASQMSDISNLQRALNQSAKKKKKPIEKRAKGMNFSLRQLEALEDLSKGVI